MRNAGLGIAAGAALTIAGRRLLAAAVERARRAAAAALEAEHSRERAAAALVVPPWVPGQCLILVKCQRCCLVDAGHVSSSFQVSGGNLVENSAAPFRGSQSQEGNCVEPNYGVNLGCASGHSLCMPCALRTVRTELLNTSMVRCPLCRAGAPPRDSPISERAVREVRLRTIVVSTYLITRCRCSFF